MRLGPRKRMDTYSLVVGNPWRVNGHQIDASDSQTALQIVYEDARRLPVSVDVTTASGKTFHLVMDEDGSTRVRDEDSDAGDGEAKQASVDQPTCLPEPSGGAVAEAAEVTDEGSLISAAPSSADEELEPDPAVFSLPTAGRDQVAEESAPAISDTKAHEADDEAQVLDPSDDGENSLEGLFAAQENAGSTAAKRPVTPLWKRPLTIGIAAAGTAALVGLGVAAVVGHDERPDSTAGVATASEAVALPASGTIAGLTGRVAVAVEDGRIRLLSPETGEQIGDEIETENPEDVRIVPTEEIDVIDTGDGAFLTYDGDADPQRFTGEVSVRGTVPVAIDEDRYRTMQNPDEQTEVPEGAAVFGATEAGAVLAKAPRTVTIGGDDLELTPPHDEAELASWVQVSEDHVVILWSGEGDNDPQILAAHDTESGEITDQTEVADDEVTVRNGTTQIGDDRYIADGTIEEVCDGGEFTHGTLLCPAGGEAWETADGLTAASRPVAISESHYVTTDHRIEELKQL